jgi:hypothetical protein
LDNVQGSPPVRPKATQDIPEGSVSPPKSGPEGIALKNLYLVAQSCVFKDQSLAVSEDSQHQFYNEFKHNLDSSAGCRKSLVFRMDEFSEGTGVNRSRGRFSLLHIHPIR